MFDGFGIRPVDNLALGPYTLYLDDFSFEPVAPPEIQCPADVVAECNLASGFGGAYVSLPAPIVSFHCSPTPQSQL